MLYWILLAARNLLPATGLCASIGDTFLDFPFVQATRISRPFSHTYIETPNNGFSSGRVSCASGSSKDSTSENAASFSKSNAGDGHSLRKI
jgi:hypothetical protein